MHNLVPHFILEKYVQGESGGRFAAVSLFADIVGINAAAQALTQHGHSAAEAVADVMQALFTPLVEQIYAHGGFIATLAGDAFTALFLEDNPSVYQRALAAAIAIQQQLVAHPVQNSPYGRFSFAVKLGLGDGEVEWGILRPARDRGGHCEPRAVYFFSGPAMAAAAAAGHQANRGNLVLSPRVAQALGKQVKTLPLSGDYVRVLGAAGALPAPQTPVAVLAPSLEAVQTAFVPSSILDLEKQGQFRQVVSVFVNLLGSESGVGLPAFVREVSVLQGQYGGYLARVAVDDQGCTLLLFWGAPVSFENDIPRALEFCLELGNHLAGTFRAGLSCRLLYAGLVGSAHRAEYTCCGDGINLAAQLMEAAPWGSLWIDEHLANRARQRFALSYVDHVACEGRAEKQPVYELLERRPADESFFAGQIVGREQELAQLAAFVQPLLAPAGERRYAGLLVVVGEAGLGKSRLVHEFQARLTAAPDVPLPPTSNMQHPTSNPQFFLCQTDQILRQPLNPFRYWLMGYFDQSPAQSAERNKRAFGRKLDQVIATVGEAALGQELQRTRSCLGALVGLEWESSLYAQLDPQGRYESTLQALKALLKAESRRRPTVLLVEDIHCLEEASQEFLRRLGREIESYPLAVLATARPERVGALLGPGYPYRQLDLGCLAPTELERLAADRLGGPAAPELVALLAERAESNPFFAEQILLYLREQGHLVCRDGTWVLAGSRDELLLPDEVHTIFIARLDRLAEEIRAVVQAAAILGREFEVRVLAAMLRVDESGEPPAELVGLVSAAEQESIWAALAELRYLFKHTLLRDAAYEMQPHVHRRSLHRLAAESLERLYAADLPAHYGEIAYHYEAACRQGLEEVRALACQYLEQAGDQAAERYENAAAVDCYSRALSLTPGEAEEGRLRLLLGREAIYFLLGRREEQRADLQALEMLVQARQRPAEQAELGLRQARLANATGDFAGAQAQAQEAVATAQAAGAVALEASARLGWATALWRLADYPGAAEQGQLSVVLAQAARCKDIQAGGLMIQGTVATFQGDYAAARRYVEQALALCQEIGDRRGEGGALNNLGTSTFHQGDYIAVRQYFEQALAIFREIGERRGEGGVLGNLGSVASYQGDYATARPYIEQHLAICREVGDRQAEGLVLNNLGSVALFQEDYYAARRYHEQSLAVSREIGDRRNEILALKNLGKAVSSQGDYAAARPHYEQALAISRQLGLAHYIAENLAGLAEVALVQGDQAGAQAHVLEMLPILEANPTLKGAEHPRRALLGCGQVLLALGDPRGRAILAAAHARLQEQAAQIADEAARRMFLENIPEHRALVAEFARLMADQVGKEGDKERGRQGEAETERGEDREKKGKKKDKKTGRGGDGEKKGTRKNKKKGAKGKKIS